MEKKEGFYSLVIVIAGLVSFFMTAFMNIKKDASEYEFHLIGETGIGLRLNNQSGDMKFVNLHEKIYYDIKSYEMIEALRFADSIKHTK